MNTARIFLCLLLFPTIALAEPTTKGSLPNIVFILADDQGYPDMGCHGNPLIQSEQQILAS